MAEVVDVGSTDCMCDFVCMCPRAVEQNQERMLSRNADRVPYSLIETTGNGSRLYLSSEEGAYALIESTAKKDLNVPLYILTINSLPLSLPPTHNVQNQLYIALDDDADQDIAPHLNDALLFIERSLAASTDGIVVVHCYAGVSRSATLVWAYLIKTQKLTPMRALTLLRKRRPFVNPNLGFMTQIVHWHATSVTM